MFDSSLLGTVEKDIFYTSDHDPNRSMDIYYPGTLSEPWPVVINVHGGAWSMGTKDWAGYSADFAKHGVLGVSINYRLSPAVKAPTHLLDVKCAIRFLRANAERFNLDPARFGIMGHSAGGHLASMAALTAGLGIFNDTGECLGYSDEVQAAAPCSGPSALLEMPQDKEICQTVFGTTDFSYPMFREYSPMTYVSENMPPFLIAHGSADQTVLLEEAEKLHNALQHFGNQSELLIIEAADHLFEVDGISHDEKVKQKVVPFFLEHLKK